MVNIAVDHEDHPLSVDHVCVNAHTLDPT
jgi:hypothetical protein